MAATKSKLKTFHVSFRGVVELDVVVTAATVEDALVKGRELKDHEVLADFDGINDSNLEVNGVWMESA